MNNTPANPKPVLDYPDNHRFWVVINTISLGAVQI